MSETFDPYHVWLGIPPEEQPATYYRLLGLQPLESNAEVIRNALDQRRGHLRSVQAGKRGVLSQQLLNEVTAAGVCLLDREKKQRYDDELRTRVAPIQQPAAPAATGIPLAHVVADHTPAAAQPRMVASPFVPTSSGPPTAHSLDRTRKSAATSVAVAAAVAGVSLLLLFLIVGIAIWGFLKNWQSPQIKNEPPAAARNRITPPPVVSPSATTGTRWIPPPAQSNPASPPSAPTENSASPPAANANESPPVSLTDGAIEKPQ